MKKIIVFFGGESVEHDVSIITGVITANAIDREKFETIPVYVTKDGKAFTGEQLFSLDNYKNLNYKKLKQVTFVLGDNALYTLDAKTILGENGKKKAKLQRICSVACALNCMHGERGEDGCIAGLMRLCKIPLASPDILPSSVCIDKHFTKIALKGLGVNVIDSVKVHSEKDLENFDSWKLNFPLIVKPNRLGSSIGIEKVENAVQLSNAVICGLRYGEFCEVESCLTDFTEINCSAYKNFEGDIVVSKCEKPIKKTEFLSFEDKYKDGEREFPAKIDKKIAKEIKRITYNVYKEFDFEGIIRIDFMLKDNTVYLNEINTVPGSLAYYFYSNTMGEFKEILNDVLDGTIRRSVKRQTEIRSFSSGLFTGFGTKGVKRLKK